MTSILRMTSQWVPRTLNKHTVVQQGRLVAHVGHLLVHIGQLLVHVGHFLVHAGDSSLQSVSHSCHSCHLCLIGPQTCLSGLRCQQLRTLPSHPPCHMSPTPPTIPTLHSLQQWRRHAGLLMSVSSSQPTSCCSECTCLCLTNSCMTHFKSHCICGTLHLHGGYMQGMLASSLCMVYMHQ